MNKFVLTVILLLFPVACSAQAEFTLSCENVTGIQIGQYETKYWPAESEDGYFYILFAELAKSAGEELMALREATPYTGIREEDGTIFQYKDIAIKRKGKRIETIVPGWTFFSKEAVGVPIILKEEAFAIAEDICPALVPEKIRTDKKFD